MTTLEHELKPPDRLTDTQRAVWQELSAIAGSRLSPVTAPSFEHLVMALANLREVDAVIQGLSVDDLVVRHSNGSQGIAPLEKLRHQRSQELRGLLKDWSLTPGLAGQYGDSHEMADSDFERWRRAEAVLCDNVKQSPPYEYTEDDDEYTEDDE